MDNTLLTLIALFLVLLNGVFVAAEFTIVKLQLTQAEELSEVKGLPGRILKRVRSQLDAHLSTCELGIMLASLMNGSRLARGFMSAPERCQSTRWSACLVLKSRLPMRTWTVSRQWSSASLGQIPKPGDQVIFMDSVSKCWRWIE